MNVDKDFEYAPSAQKAKDWQQAIVKEIALFDQLCLENGIEYFIFGGGLLGAVRHRGFIPWDNDVDVCMTEENYNKLVQLYKSGKFPKDHALACRETEEQYPLLFGRFVNTATSCPLSTAAFNGGMHGLFLDVFIMYPMPDDPAQQQEAIDSFLVWEELLCYMKIRSSKRNASFIKKWLELKEYEKAHGRKEALAHAEEQFRAFFPAKPNWYLFSSGGTRNAYPLTKAEWYEETVRIPFEGIMVNAPKGRYQMLRTHYGNSWRRVPKENPSFKAYSGANLNIPAKIVSQDYMQLLDAQKCDEDFRLCKDLEAQLMVIENPYLEINYDALCELIGKNIEKELAGLVDADTYSKASTYAQKSFDLEAALAQYEKLGVISNEQLRDEMRTWHSPVLMDARYVASMIWIRLATLHDFWIPAKVSSLQEKNPSYAAYLQTEDGKVLSQLFKAIGDLYEAIDINDAAQLEESMNYVEQHLPHSVHAQVGRAASIQDDSKALLAFFEQQPKLFKQNDYLRFYQAKALALVGQAGDAQAAFSQLAHYSTSGLIRLWVKDFCAEHGIQVLPKNETEALNPQYTPEYELHSLNRYAYGFKRWRPIFKRAGLKMSGMRKQREALQAQIEEVEKRIDTYRNARRLTDRRFQAWERFYPRKQALLDAAQAGDEELVLKLARPYVDAFHSCYSRYGYGLFIDKELERIVLPILRKKDGDDAVQKRLDAIPSQHRINIDELLRSNGVDHPYFE